MTMRILVDEDLLYVRQIFSRLGVVVPVDGYNIPVHKLKSADALIVRSITTVDDNLLRDFPIKFIGSVTSGIDHLDQNWLIRSGIKYVNTPGCNSRAVVEYVFSALFFLAKRDNFFLRDKVVGIVGVGNIGKLLQKFLELFGVQTLLCDPILENSGVSGNWKSLEELVSEADVLTLHVPLEYNGTYSTWHMVDDELLSALPSNRILINTCRGGVVCNSALLRALQNGKKLSVVLDVWEFEPLISLSLLSYVDIGTPHIAGASIESKIRGAIQIYRAYSDFFSINNIDDDYLSSLFSQKKNLMRLHHTILDENILCYLINYVYNIRRDDILLRYFAGKIGQFEYFRKYYFNRREWSSLYVQTDINSDIEILIKLGFGNYYI